MVFLRGGIAPTPVVQEEGVVLGLGEAAAGPDAAVAAEDVDLEVLTVAGLEHDRNRAELHRQHRDHPPAPEALACRQQALQFVVVTRARRAGRVNASTTVPEP